MHAWELPGRVRAIASQRLARKCSAKLQQPEPAGANTHRKCGRQPPAAVEAAITKARQLGHAVKEALKDDEEEGDAAFGEGRGGCATGKERFISLTTNASLAVPQAWSLEITQ
jgi:hypothetical protein